MGSAGAVRLLCAALLLAAGCERIPVTKLYALRAAAPPQREAWRTALPLSLKAGGGNLNSVDRRLADLALDTDAVHLGSASCHHGPPITAPVLLSARAFYTDDAVHVEVSWDDSTADTVPGSWRRGAGGWKLDEAEEDGVAILWSNSDGPFGCQEACHMSDFAIRQGALIDLRSMYLADAGGWEEAWIWRPFEGAHALVLGGRGFVTVAGEAYRTVNSAAAVDPDLMPEARRAGTFGPDDRPTADASGRPLGGDAVAAPAHLYAPGGDRGGLTASAERTQAGWRVVLSRALHAGERRRNFVPGGSYRFGVAVFDATTTNHHIVRDTQTLELVGRDAEGRAPGAGPGGADPQREPAGIL